MHFFKNVSCQDALFSSPFCRFALPFFFFLLTVLAPLDTWADYINIISPTAGDVWYAGETYTIQWSTTSTMSTARIYLQKNGKQKYTITSNASNNGSYSWTIPTDMLSKSNDEEGDQYGIAICTDDCCGDGEYFSLAFPSTTSPGTPSSFTVIAQSSTGIDLSWNAISNAMEYDVYTCVGAFVGNTAQPSYLVNELRPETSYSYKVRSSSAEGSSDFTACQTATTLSNDPDSHTISGRTKKADGTAILNATVNFTGLTSVQSISNGAYRQAVPKGWSGSACASKSGCNFACVSVFNMTGSKSGVDLICEEPRREISSYAQR